MNIKVKLPFPWMTLLLTSICLVFFGLFKLYSSANLSESNLFSEIGAPYAIQIYRGQYWGLITNSLIHINLLHLVLNLTGLWLFGAFIERRLKFFKLFFLGLLASILTSLFQLTLTGDAGIGMTGVNYFLLAFILGKSLQNDRFKLKGLYVYVTLFILFIPASYYINTLDTFKIGIEAMIIGLVFGLTIGWLSNFKSKVIIGMIIGLATIGSTATLFYSPWSAEWNYTKGYEYHLNNDILEAEGYYQKAMKIDPNHSASRENLRIIRLEILSEYALRSHENRDYIKAREYYDEILKIDPNNSWAKENLKKLP